MSRSKPSETDVIETVDGRSLLGAARPGVDEYSPCQRSEWGHIDGQRPAHVLYLRLQSARRGWSQLRRQELVPAPPAQD